MFVQRRPNLPQPTPDTRERILDTAEALFAEKGLIATSVRDIATAAGLTPASLYNHFEGKEALYAAVLERGIRPLFESLEETPEAGSEEMHGVILRRAMSVFGARPNVARLIYHEAIGGGTHLVPLLRDWIPPIMARALGNLKRDVEFPFSEQEYRHVVAMWAQLIVGYFAVAPLMNEFLDGDALAPESVERQTRFLLDIAHRIATGEPLGGGAEGR